MDDLFGLAVALVLYLVFQFLGSGKKKPKRPPGTPQDDGLDRPQTLEDAWREIERALGGGEPRPETRPEPTLEVETLPDPERPLPARSTERPTALEKAVEADPAMKPPGRTFQPEPFRAEQQFEGTQGFHEAGFEEPWVHTAHEPFTPLPEQIPPRPRRRAVQDLGLHHPGGARRAVLLSEILGPPRSEQPHE